MRILGISPAHDGSIAVVNNGKIECFLKEERYSRIKRDNMPWKSIELVQGKIDKIIYTTPTSHPNDALFKDILTKKFNCSIADISGEHHLCHASLAYYNSGFDTALVFVIDRNGSAVGNVMREAESIFIARQPFDFETIHKNFWAFNIGADSDKETLKYNMNADSTMSVVKVYETATTLIGQHPLENGKTMGLAAYGKDKPYNQFFVNNRPHDNLFVHDYFVVPDQTTTLMRSHLGRVIKDVPESNYELYADHAFQVQKQTQDYVLKMIHDWVFRTGITNVCITGGYGLNVVANSHYVKNLPYVKFYFEPLADDTGNSIGAALIQSKHEGGEFNITPMKHQFIHGFPHALEVFGDKCDINDIVDLLEQQKSVAVFNGQAEAGPRALGNRSILFDARNPDAKQIVNRIKKREWYRPFAAAVLKEDFNLHFDTLGLDESPNMTMSFQVKDSSIIPGVVHADNSCRVQTTMTNEVLDTIVKEFKNRTGVGVLLNTSFNIAGEPLVETQDDAIRTFNETELDALWFPETGTLLKKDTL